MDETETPTPTVNAQRSRAAEELNRVITIVIRELTNSIAEELSAELSRTLNGVDIEQELKNGIVPYIVASGTLGLSGRDIDKDGVMKLIESINIKPDMNRLNTVASLRYKNRIVYIVAVYFLIANSIEPTEAGIMRVISALDIHPDASIAAYVMGIYRKRVGADKPQLSF
ncbi:MAG: hypothetical protein KGH72_03740 [Candidatus Micrarchaeota archaeon]|nr:hypothetical protein [Candidatus Micrarchaeota archaeon]